MNARPLKLLGHAIQTICGIQYHRLNKDGTVRPSLHYTGWRGRVQLFAIGLQRMSRGSQYDNRTLLQRIASGVPCIRLAFTGKFR